MKTSKNNYRFTAAVLGVTVLLWIASAVTHAGMLYFNGFEPGDPGTADFSDSTTNVQPPPNSEMTIVPSGTGGILAAGGNFYAQINNVPDAFSNGYGQSVATDYGYVRNGGTYVGGAPTGPGVANNGQPFYESTDYYIDPTWSAPASAANDNIGFWIDTTPYNDPTYADETNFRVTNGGNGTINVQMVGYGTAIGGVFPSINITTAGWYNFKTTFEDDGGNVSNTLSVSDLGGTVLGSAFNDPGNYNPPAGITGPLAWSDLQGTNYGDWTTVWSDGFAGNTLDIDNVEVGTVPEPASLSLLALGAPMLLRRRRRA
jgi:hypothetical protein